MRYVDTLLIIFCSGSLLGAAYTFPEPDTSRTSNESIVLKTPNLVAFWDFREPESQARKARGKAEFTLQEESGTLPRINEGPLSGYSALFTTDAYLSMPHSETGKLNIFGKNQAVTVVAYVKWKGTQPGFVGGMWNEYRDGGKRQYGLFVSLPHYNGRNQVCGHISQTGKPTPPFPYSIDYSASKQTVPPNEWVCVAFSYDGTYIKSYVNGVFAAREPELIDHTVGFEGYPNGLTQSKNPYYFPNGIGNNGSDFTVGAVLLKAGMGNRFRGQIGGLAVFDRALTNNEMLALAKPVLALRKN
ncbi:LamG-like jellyroll fold domain-containing protein [Spirosoma areae]